MSDLIDRIESIRQAQLKPAIGEIPEPREAILDRQWRRDFGYIMDQAPTLAEALAAQLDAYETRNVTGQPQILSLPIHPTTRLPTGYVVGDGGINRATGKYVTGWQHVAQSIFDILSTPLGTRVMRRMYGSRIFDLMDRPMSAETVMEVFLATAEALERWEPRFKLRNVRIVEAEASGRFSLAVYGSYFPRGHLGDYSEYLEPDGVLVSL